MDDLRPTRRRRSVILSLRVLLGLVALIAIVMGWWVNTARLQKRAVDRVTRDLGTVVYDYEMTGDGKKKSAQAQNRRGIADAMRGGQKFSEEFLRSATTTPLPPAHPLLDWSRRILGPDYVYNVTQVHAVSLKLNDADMDLIAGLPHLTFLNLSQCPISDAGLKKLLGLRRLRFLSLASTRVDDVSLSLLPQFTDLDDLDLTNAPITDAGLVQVGKLRGLRRLNLTYVPVTAAGLDHLRGLDRLEELNLNGNDLSDDDLLSIAKLRGLKVLSLVRTASHKGGRIPVEIAEALGRALPDLHINGAPSRNDAGQHAADGTAPP